MGFKGGGVKIIKRFFVVFFVFFFFCFFGGGGGGWFLELLSRQETVHTKVRCTRKMRKFYECYDAYYFLITNFFLNFKGLTRMENNFFIV